MNSSPARCSRATSTRRGKSQPELPRQVPIPAPPLAARKPGEGIERGARIRVGIKPHSSRCADASPVAGEQGAPEQIRPDLDPVEAPLIALGPDARERRGLGEEEKLDRLGHGVIQYPGHKSSYKVIFSTSSSVTLSFRRS